MKKDKTPGLFDEEFKLRKLSTKGDPLEKLNRLINWEMFRPTIAKVFEKEAKGPGGRPRYDFILMFKILILQRTYNISDEQMEYQINDRLSFMRFLGLTIRDDVPDQNTIWDFREALSKDGTIEKLFNLHRDELEKQKLILNKGSIIDASFVDVPKQRNNRDENNDLKEGKIPEDWKEDPKKLSHKDIDARWMTKNHEIHYGYKNHVKADKDKKIITAYAVTSASEHDSQAIDKLIGKKDAGKSLHADSAYSGQPIEEKLEKLKIINKIHEKGYSGNPLTETQFNRNRKKSKIRARVEHIFGFMENSMRSSRIKTIGIRRAKAVIGLINITYNMFRSMQLKMA